MSQMKQSLSKILRVLAIYAAQTTKGQHIFYFASLLTKLFHIHDRVASKVASRPALRTCRIIKKTNWKLLRIGIGRITSTLTKATSLFSWPENSFILLVPSSRVYLTVSRVGHLGFYICAILSDFMNMHQYFNSRTENEVRQSGSLVSMYVSYTQSGLST